AGSSATGACTSAASAPASMRPLANEPSSPASRSPGRAAAARLSATVASSCAIVVSSVDRNAVADGATDCSARLTRSSYGIAVELLFQACMALRARDPRDPAQVLVARVTLVAVEDAEADVVRGLGQAPRRVHVARVVAHAVPVRVRELRDDDAVVVLQQLHDIGVAHGRLEDPGREDRAALEDAHEAEAAV